MLIRNAGTLVALGACGLLGGCALQQKVTLAQPPSVASSADVAIQLTDSRDSAQKSTHIEGRPRCVRSYGDDFIAPSKMTYFRQVLESRAKPHTHADLVIDRFETLEYCDKTAGEVTAAAIAGATHVYFGAPTTGNSFQLRVAGKINGTPFEVSRWFSYDDIKFLNFPSETREYRERMEQAVQGAADEVLAAAANRSGAQVAR